MFLGFSILVSRRIRGIVICPVTSYSRSVDWSEGLSDVVGKTLFQTSVSCVRVNGGILWRKSIDKSYEGVETKKRRQIIKRGGPHSEGAKCDPCVKMKSGWEQNRCGNNDGTTTLLPPKTPWARVPRDKCTEASVLEWLATRSP